jgi:hypothetical protein
MVIKNLAKDNNSLNLFLMENIKPDESFYDSFHTPIKFIFNKY